jgi:hypothetical protein
MSLLRALPARAPGAPTAARAAIRSRLAWATMAIAGWSGVGYLALQLASAVPSRAGFDLELLLVAGRRVAAGLSPYDLASLGALSAEDLFYSYPPPLAQALALLAPLPMPAVLALLALASLAGLLLVARALGARLAPDRPAVDVVLPVLALAPLLFPFAIAVLFGNLDATFPFAYGLLAVAVLAPAGRLPVAAGVALAAASISKLHPASLFVWFALRGGRPARLVAASTLVAGVGIVAVSLLVGGVTPWIDYLEVVRAGAAADLLDRRNVGPAAQAAMLIGGGEGVARVAQAVVSLGAIGVTAYAALRRTDALESLSWAATASLITLPVTWFHYPVALIPFAIAAWLRASGTPQARGVLRWLAAAGVVAAVAIALPVTVWLAVACVLVAVRRSVPR